MKLNQKSKIALGIIANDLDHKSISDSSGLSSSQLINLERSFRKKAFLAFAPALLDISVASLAACKSGITAVQVGANDGREGDPVNSLIHKYATKALLIEPIPQLIGPLKATYKDFTGELLIENVAIGNSSTTFELNILDPEYWNKYIEMVGRHPTAISSVYREPLVKKISARLRIDRSEADRHVIKIECPQYTLSNILHKNGITDVDLMQIDCEGHDVVVIQSLNNIRPRIIHFESVNLSVEHWNSWKSWAAKNNYGWIQGPHDTLAIHGAHFRCEF